jgi:peptidoglycan/xylan/chitin deacetylase (PgdA/CDA1 family)
MASIRTEWDLRQRSKEGVPILMFHKIAQCSRPTIVPELYVSPRRLHQMLVCIRYLALQSISVGEALDPGCRDNDSLVITFDDGYENVLLNAAQDLRWLGFRATQFLVADRLGRCNDWDIGVDATNDRLMDKEQIRDWLSLGFEIGAHTRTHAHLTQISPARAKEEISGSKARLEDLFGMEVKYFAYPYGEYNDTVVELTKAAGFKAACTCEPTSVISLTDPFRLGRFLVHERSIRSIWTYNAAFLYADLKALTGWGKRN